MQSTSVSIPIIDLSLESDLVAEAIGNACEEWGLFYVVGHGVEPLLLERLVKLSRQFFALDVATKLKIRMELGGRAWRGYFPVGQELTSGLPDQKEGLYFGAELPDEHPKVVAQTPLHGRNLFPHLPGFREAVLAYLGVMIELGHRLLAALAVSLACESSYFVDRYTNDPFILFRIFYYPALSVQPSRDQVWSVGEHTDYGFLTILWQDEAGGLQVKSRGRWIDAPPLDGAFVCNIGDMLERITGSKYRSTPHRVLNFSGRSRLSFPFFFDPSFDAIVEPIPHLESTGNDSARWDGVSVHDFSGAYGEYVLRKVSNVFPELGRQRL